MKKTAVKLLGIAIIIMAAIITYCINGWALIPTAISVVGGMVFTAASKGDSLEDIKEDLQDVKEDITNTFKNENNG